jgi:RimJ/RimL family protein N-acetyltransferase
LEEFDQEYFQELEGQDGWKAIGQENCMNQSYFTVCDESGEKLGIVGLYDTDDEKNITHIVIDPKHRGKGMLPKFYEALTGSTGADYLVATIDRNNTASIRSHEKAGFRKTSDDKYEEEFDKFRYQYDVPEED